MRWIGARTGRERSGSWWRENEGMGVGFRGIRSTQPTTKVIAQGRNIREVENLVREFGGDIKGWKKMKGWDEYGQEWHWYYHPNVGRVKIKPK